MRVALILQQKSKLAIIRFEIDNQSVDLRLKLTTYMTRPAADNQNRLNY